MKRLVSVHFGRFRRKFKNNPVKNSKVEKEAIFKIDVFCEKRREIQFIFVQPHSFFCFKFLKKKGWNEFKLRSSQRRRRRRREASRLLLRRQRR